MYAAFNQMKHVQYVCVRHVSLLQKSGSKNNFFCCLLSFLVCEGNLHPL